MQTYPNDLNIQQTGIDLIMRSSQEGDPACIKIIANVNTIPAVIMALENHSTMPQLVHNACIIFENLLISSRDADVKAALVNTGGVATLGKLFNTYMQNTVIRDRVSTALTLAIQP